MGAAPYRGIETKGIEMGYETEMSALAEMRRATNRAYRRQFDDLCDGGTSIDAACDQLEIRHSTGYFWAAKVHQFIKPTEDQRALLKKAKELHEAEWLAKLRKGMAGQ